jgi:hypothetical protein
MIGIGRQPDLLLRDRDANTPDAIRTAADRSASLAPMM